jgi:hypothetical protein
LSIFRNSDSQLRNETIKDITNDLGQPSAAPSHIYDKQRKQAFTVEMHGHLLAIQRDFAEGKMMVPKG